MSKGFWIVLASIFGITTISLTLYIYTKDAYLKTANNYVMENDTLLGNNRNCADNVK